MSDTLAVTVGGIIPVKINSIEKIELLELLGVGGFSSVWKVKDQLTNHLYVLKIIQGIKPGSPMVERIHREATVAIPSEYIVPVIGLRQWNERTFLILFEYVPGKSLDKILEEGYLTSKQKRKIFEQTLLGVRAAHHCNIIHRDMKPSNILVGNDGQVKIIDFGVSKFCDLDTRADVTLSGEIMGTLEYMAPELVEHGAKIADARVDIYALGHILYELAMGEHFWRRKGWKIEDFAVYLNKTPIPMEAIQLDDFHCDFYQEVTPILAQMVKIDPEERYDSVDNILSDLGYIPQLPEFPKDLHLRYPLLIVDSGSNQGARTLINIEEGNSLVLGRADIAGADRTLSSQHVEFIRQGDKYFVRDLGSKNGTMIKGKVVKNNAILINHGDRIKVGDVFLCFAFFKPAL